MMSLKKAVLTIGLLALAISPVLAEELTRAEMEALIYAQQAQMQQMQQQINQLSDLIAGVQADQAVLERHHLDRTASYQSRNWTDKTSITGDLRLRYEIQTEDSTRRDTSRDRLRARARISLTNQFAEDLRLGVRLVTGSDDSAISTNQSFGGNASKTQVWFDRYFAEWSPTEWFVFTGGKFSDPFTYTQMLIDGDVMFEGAAQEFKFKEEGMDLRLRLGQFLIHDTSWDSKDIWLLAIQGGGYFDLSDDLRLDAMLGYWDYSNQIKRRPLAGARTDGNRHDGTGVRLDDYNILQPHLALNYNGVDGWPIKVYGEYVQNLDTSVDDEGWHVGFDIGQARREGGFRLGAFYQRLEANAVLDVLTDSDFYGGGTNNKGFGAKAAYAIRDNWTFNVAGLFAKTESGPKKDFNTYQFDTAWRF